ncbi:MAG: hypothetical protein ACK5NT_03775 [Pyrinomonadaceae bacterium]
MEFKPKARHQDIVVQEIGEETMVYDLLTHKAKCLNKTSAAVWKLCNGKRDIRAITMVLSANLKINVEQNLVLLALAQLNNEDLVVGEETSRTLSPFQSGSTRRELIKKAGLAAVIGLPLISSVVAPNAASAASFQECTGNSGDAINCVCQHGISSCQGVCDDQLAIFCSANNRQVQTCNNSMMNCQNGDYCTSIGVPAGQKCCLLVPFTVSHCGPPV